MTAKKILLATLVKKNDNQRFYKLSKPLKTLLVYGEPEPIEFEEAEFDYEWRDSVPRNLLSDGYRLICISDALYHIERLVFGAVDRGEGPEGLAYRVLHGEYTSPWNGGDPSTVRPDIEYIRELAEANGYEFGGITEE